MLTDHPFAAALPLADRLRLLADDLRDDALAVTTLHAADLADCATDLVGPAHMTPLPMPAPPGGAATSKGVS